jgi:hypothetical protein
MPKAETDRDVYGARETFPVVEDHPGAGTQRVQICEGDIDVSAAILLKAVPMELVAVHLYCRNLVHDEVDASQVAEAHLGLDLSTGETKPRSGQALRQGLAGLIHPVRDAAITLGQAKDERFEVDLVESAGVERPIEHGDSILEGFVEDHTPQRIQQIYGCCGAAVANLALVPVQYHSPRRAHIDPLVTIPLAPQPGGIAMHRNMKRTLAEYPGIH